MPMVVSGASGAVVVVPGFYSGEHGDDVSGSEKWVTVTSSALVGEK